MIETGSLPLSKEEIFHSLSLSSYEYLSPITPRSGEKVRFWQDSPAHVGPYRHALDIIIPDPRINSLPVLAPQDGRIIALVQDNTEYGDSQDYLFKLNYVTVQVGKSEFYELCHIDKESCKYEIGDTVKKGNIIAKTGVNGWMTDVRHLHFMVGKWLPNNQFQSLKIRFRQK